MLFGVDTGHVGVERRPVVVHGRAVLTLEAASILQADVDLDHMLLKILVVGRRERTLVTVENLTGETLVHHAVMQLETLTGDEGLGTRCTGVGPYAGVCTCVYLKALAIAGLVRTERTTVDLRRITLVDELVLFQVSGIQVFLIANITLKIPAKQNVSLTITLETQ